MYIEVKESTGITGASVEFTNQELVAIKDKWEEVTEDMDKTNSKQRVRVNLEVLQEMDILMNKMLELIPSSSEIHTNLFEVSEKSGQEKLNEHLAGKIPLERL